MAVAIPALVIDAVAAPSVIVPAAEAPVRLFSRYPVSLVRTPEVGVPSSGVVKAILVAVAPLGSASTPVELVLMVALPLVEPFRTSDPPVPPFVPRVVLLVPVMVVNAPLPGVVPPMAPGDGNDEVEPPKATEVPAIVIAEFDKPPFGIPVKLVPVSVGAVLQENPVVVENCITPVQAGNAAKVGK